MATIKINFNITDLTNESLEDYSCNICLENIYKKELYQCKEGHVACSSCWSKIISNNQQCMECRIQIKSISELSRARFIEQQLLRKFIKCPYTFLNIHDFQGKSLVTDLFNGCNQSITIENLEYHLSNCEHRFLKCENIGCFQTIRKNNYFEHQGSCYYKILECPYCIKPFAKYLHLQHYDECPSVSIKCPSCDSNFKRSELNQHIENQCENTIIKCKYFKYGCNQYQIKRKELNQHLIEINHSIEIGKYIEELNENIFKLNNKVIDKDHSIKKLNEEISKLSIINNLLLQTKNKYKNKWIIEDKKDINSYLINIKSPIFKIGDFEFQLELFGIMKVFPLYEAKINLFCLKSIPVQFSSSIKIINHLKSDQNIKKKFFKNLTGSYETVYDDLIFTREKGWLNSDDQLKLEFTIKFNEPENLKTK